MYRDASEDPAFGERFGGGFSPLLDYYRARPRLRRRRSAGLGLRGFGFGFVARLPTPAISAAALWRVGARRRASRQMKNEIAPISPTATTTMPTPSRVVKPLPPPELLVELVVAGGVVVVGVVACAWGSGVNGLLEL
jgi:hypothetical protein